MSEDKWKGLDDKIASGVRRGLCNFLVILCISGLVALFIVGKVIEGIEEKETEMYPSVKVIEERLQLSREEAKVVRWLMEGDIHPSRFSNVNNWTRHTYGRCREARRLSFPMSPAAWPEPAAGSARG